MNIEYMENRNNIPQHVAIIMDGNGRWAKEKGLPRSHGHREGINRLKEIVRVAAGLKIEVLTLFAFSTENWARPKKEIDMLMRALNNFLGRQVDELHKNNIRFKVIGSKEPLPRHIIDKIEEAEDKTKNNTGLVCVLALNYGGRQEILDAAKNLARLAIQGAIDIDSLDTEAFSQYFYTAGLPDPDLLIRTSGEMRISNFLLWQLSYTELYFSKKYWPDFRKEDLERALDIFQKRKRRFGGIYVDKENN